MMFTPDECTKEELRTWPTYELQVQHREGWIDQHNGVPVSPPLTDFYKRVEQVLVERHITIQKGNKQ